MTNQGLNEEHIKKIKNFINRYTKINEKINGDEEKLKKIQNNIDNNFEELEKIKSEEEEWIKNESQKLNMTPKQFFNFYLFSEQL